MLLLKLIQNTHRHFPLYRNENLLLQSASKNYIYYETRQEVTTCWCLRAMSSPSEVVKTSGLSNAHHQLTRKALLCVAVALSQSGEELGHALVLGQS